MSLNYRRKTHDGIRWDPEFNAKMNMSIMDRGSSLLMSMEEEEIENLLLKYNNIVDKTSRNKITFEITQKP